MARRKAPFGNWNNNANQGADVVDVEAREVPDKAKQPHQLPRE
jgi:hypothetical protein